MKKAERSNKMILTGFIDRFRVGTNPKLEGQEYHEDDPPSYP
jgi:hypothetical protein